MMHYCTHCSLGAEGGMSRYERDMQGDYQPFTQAREATTDTDITNLSRHIPSSQPETIGAGHSKSLRQRRGLQSNTTLVVQESNGAKLGHMVSSHSATHENVFDDPARAAVELAREVANRGFDMARQHSEERLAIMASNERKEEKIRDLERRNSKVMCQLEQKKEQITNLTNELHQMKERRENEELEHNRVKNELREKERKISELEQTIHQKSENEIKLQLQQIQQTLEEEKREKHELEERLAQTTRRIEHLEKDVRKADSEVEERVRDRKCLEDFMQWTKEDIEEEADENDEITSLMAELEMKEREALAYKYALSVVFAILVLSLTQRRS